MHTVALKAQNYRKSYYVQPHMNAFILYSLNLVA